MYKRNIFCHRCPETAGERAHSDQIQLDNRCREKEQLNSKARDIAAELSRKENCTEDAGIKQIDEDGEDDRDNLSSRLLCYSTNT
jgi:hypothetical protein